MAAGQLYAGAHRGGPHERTLLVVMGDHGQTLGGDHGGASQVRAVCMCVFCIRVCGCVCVGGACACCVYVCLTRCSVDACLLCVCVHMWVCERG